MKPSVLKKIVLIGASTGGPGQIEKILQALPKLLNTSVVIAQHMAVDFIPSFAKRMQEQSANKIFIAKNNSCLEHGCVYICSGYTKIQKSNSQYIFVYEESPQYGFNPDINILFHSFAPFCGSIETLGVILTGIGSDGVSGCSEIGLRGAACLTESKVSAIVDGMPERAREQVEGIKVLDMKDIVTYIKEFCE